jgi:diaminohydroxyphosphoribosylaminopyrimidine deaminase/5-amino-6-(5-phosphoribosylamino)uracil reductase
LNPRGEIVRADEAFMVRALALAERARGRTTPNPLVGAVVVTPDGVVAGAGYHARAGEPHAEIHALRQAREAARGGTLYCTLEPCNYYGRTPPCVDRIIEAGIARVVIAVEDPNPRVAGGGVAALRRHGIRVEVGVRRENAIRLNRPFFSVMRRGRPFVIAKVATSLDGRVAARAGVCTALSSPAVHRTSQLLRAEVDAIAVGSGTVLIDNPRLTVRDVFRERPLVRVVFDRRLRTPPGAQVFHGRDGGHVLVLTAAASLEQQTDKARALEQAGAEVVVVDPENLEAAFERLVPFMIHSVLLEGGPTLHRAAMRADVIDAVRIIVTPRTLGEQGVPWLSATELSIPALQHVVVSSVGPDVIIEGDVHGFD